MNLQVEQARLSFVFLGSFQATLAGQPISGFESNRVRALLAYLAVEVERPQPREKLIGLFWPNWPEQSARNNLRGALSNLRKAIGERDAVTPCLCVSHYEIQFNRVADVWVDTWCFEHLLKRDTPALEKAIELYGGEFLDGFSLNDSPAFEEWLLLKREQFRRQVLSALRHLADSCQEMGDYERCVVYARRQVTLEPWQEEAHRQLMRVLALSGQRAGALAQYEICRRALAQELRVEPSAETIHLYEQIRDETLKQARDVPDSSPVLAELSHPVQNALVPKNRQGEFRWRHWRQWAVLLSVVVVVLLLVGLVAFEKRREEANAVRARSLEDVKVAMICEGTSPPQICMMTPHDGQVTRLTHDLAFHGIHPVLSWSPDGRYLLFAAEPPAWPMQMYRLDTHDTTGAPISLLGEGAFSVWSPDGKWITFQQDGELWLMRSDGSDARQLFRACAEAPSWSPDSEWIAFIDGACGDPQRKSAAIRLIRLDGRDEQVVASFDQVIGGELAWSLDGKQIACFCAIGTEGGTWLLNVDGSGQPQRSLEPLPSWRANYWPQWGGGR